MGLTQHSGPQASAWVTRWSTWLPAGARVLDFAGGAGRNLPPLLARGARVTLADRDAQALALARQRAAALSAPGPVEVRLAGDAAGQLDRSAGGLETREADLENAPWPFGERGFDAVICCNFLHRPRQDLLAALVAPGGLLIQETFAQGNARYGRPSNPEFLLQPGELFRAAERAGLVVLAFEHGFTPTPGPAIVQRVCAMRPPFDAARIPLAPG